ncbi:DUF4113 domain-containing protein [Paramagnetospirillum kuznetsovii]
MRCTNKSPSCTTRWAEILVAKARGERRDGNDSPALTSERLSITIIVIT